MQIIVIGGAGDMGRVACAATVADPEFVSLPAAATAARSLTNYHDPRLMDLDDASLVEAGWKITGGALRTFTASSRLAVAPSVC